MIDIPLGDILLIMIIGDGKGIITGTCNPPFLVRAVAISITVISTLDPSCVYFMINIMKNRMLWRS